MDVLFLNSMEKVDERGVVFTGRVSIGEQQGVWYVMWTEDTESGASIQESWYEGLHWDEMLNAFRQRVIAKQCEGYKPLLEVRVSELDALDARSAYTSMLHFYSEGHADEALYEELRQWRLKQASQEGKAPFIVATNRLLKMISAFIPHTEEELRQIPGMGKARAGKFAKDILSLTAQVERSTAFPLDWVGDKIDPLKLNGWLLEEKERKRKAESDKLENKRMLLEAIARGETLDELQSTIQVQRRELVGWVEELDKEGYDLGPYIDLILARVPDSEREQAWQAFEQQGDRYLKPILQQIRKPELLTPKETELAYEWLRFLRLKFRQEKRDRRAREEEAS
ncbi:HRDC domain-containing protein [Paenibacillus sp. UNCCL117]|uniref:HRDC domain-containing protein n=1 Tax=unclassified Paenibacillus TaxID=185978 RepID=UPI0008893AFC|nr:MULTISPECIES: HRDC domain-containing protein [unclassified Paenibacillus]SDC01382.1 HRDC domain-containing protein [Paenibacillus sp. cl123]SFW36588.1 HRDC domain-containing protein [Paenibacillus sp. UNCCL117]